MNKLLVLLAAIVLLSCDKGESGEDNTTPPADSPGQLESIRTKYYLPTTIWGQSKNEVKKVMTDYSLLFEDTRWLIFENSNPYILMAYEFASNQLCAAYRYVPENSEILYKFEIYKFHEQNFSKLPEYSYTCYWDEASKTYMQPLVHDFQATRYYGYIWMSTEYIE